MIIKLNINRKKQKDEIWESFTVTPNNKMTSDSKRAIYQKIFNERNKNSIHKLGYKLIEIKDFENIIVYVFEFNDNLKLPKMNESIQIEYSPVLGKKLCNKCYHYKNGYCKLKGKKLHRKSYYKCFYWVEKSDWNRSLHVFKQN